MAERVETDVLIVGAGPIGIELAVALKRAGVDYLHVDAGPIGATLRWWAPGTVFFSSPERLAIAGVPLTSVEQNKPTGERYLAYLRGVVEQFGLEISTYERVTGMEARAGGGFVVTTRRGRAGDREGREIGAQRVVLAVGDMHRARLLGVEGEGLSHVSHYLSDPHDYYGRRVLIVGGKNSAVEAAIRLYRVGARVTISYWREAFDRKRVKYWLLPELEWLIEKGRIGFLARTVPARIGERSVELVSVDEDCSPNGERTSVEADDVLLLTGYVQDPTLFNLAGVELVGEAQAPRHNRRTMQTNVPGVFVAGTAAAGTQVGGVKVFIETSHVHVERIVRAITGHGVEREVPDEHEHDALPES